jgi:hypothetical protein
MKCSQCQIDNGQSASKFCTSCGASMSLSCSTCGMQIPEGARFCPECGSPTLPQALKSSITADAPISVQTTAQKIGIDFPASDFDRVQITAPFPLSGLSNVPAEIASNSMASRFAKFWALGKLGPFACWKFSNNSQEEAQQLANERVRQISEKFRKEKIPPQKYLYSDQRLREPVIEEIHNSVISRNAYGCLVLNTADVMFVDVDFPVIKRPSLLRRLFKGPEKDVSAETLSQIESWTANNDKWGWRVYRTFAGYRLLATNGVFSPESPEVDAVFKSLGSDPLYQVLCKVQKCFRARLTPKPWRCDVAAPSVRWPWASDEESNIFKNWEQKYDLQSKNFATCKLVKAIGNPIVHPSVQPIIELHDRLTLVGKDLPLA